MNCKTVLFLVTVTFFFLFSNCGKEEETPPDDLVFHSLIAEKDTIAPGESTSLKAAATGNHLEYYWSATLGDIIGSGAEVTYVASPCAVGANEITCTVTSGNQNQIKTIEIVVYE